MKRIFTLIAAAVFAALPLSARTVSEPESTVKQETRDYRLSGFTGLNVSWVYQVELTQSARYAVRVEAPEDLMPYLRVEVQNGNLILALEESLPREIRRRIENGNRANVRAFVSMPDLTTLRLSGASKLTAKGEFSSRKGFDLMLSGAVNVQDLSVKASSAVIELSGASKTTLTGKYDKMVLHLSGSASANLAADVKNSEITTSGAAKLTVKGKLGEVVLKGSGAANTQFEGSIDSLDADGSGAAKLTATQAPAARARINFSGAANGLIDVRDELSVNLSGASKLNYHPGPSLRITDQTVSRAASLSSF